MIFRKQIGWCVAQMYRLAGLRARRIQQIKRTGAILPIVFHAAEPEEVRAVLAWLKRADLLSRLAITFDDGWRQFLATLPVLEEFGARAILFIAPGETELGSIWTDGTTIPQRQALYGVDADRRVAELKRLRIARERKLMTADEVRQVARHPLVTIGNHTWSHLSCTSRPFEEVIGEIERAQKQLSEWCGYEPTEFAYPFGRGTPELDAALRTRGLRAHYTRQGVVTRETVGAARNMVYEGMSLEENLGRILMAWPKVGVTL